MTDLDHLGSRRHNLATSSGTPRECNLFSRNVIHMNTKPRAQNVHVQRLRSYKSALRMYKYNLKWARMNLVNIRVAC